MNSTIKKPAVWIAIHFTLTAINCILLFLFINATGIEIISHFFAAVYYYPILIITSYLLGIVFPALQAYRGMNCIRSETSFIPPVVMRIGSLFITFMLILFTSLYLKDINERINGKKATAPQLYHHRAGPFIQLGPSANHHLSTDGSMVIWYLDNTVSPGRVLQYGKDPYRETMKSRLEEPGGDGKRHEFILQDLDPSTTYYYRVPGFIDQTFSFRTAPGKESHESFRFVCMGDTGNTRKGGDGFSYYRDVMRASDYHYSEIGQRPSFRIHLGDIVKTGRDLTAWNTFFATDYIHSSRIPTVMAMGNHEFLEDYGANASYFFAQPRYLTFQYGNAFFLIIHPFDGPCTSIDGPILSTGREQYSFIKRELERQMGNRWIIVAIHIPILSSGDYGSNEILKQQYFELFKKHKVDLVLSGHDHDFELFHVEPESGYGGTIYVVAGTGGSRSDSYIMDRQKRKWLSWQHDCSSAHGLYQHDPLTEKYHVYGELSWGFVDVNVTPGKLTVTYYRWLSYPDFLKITGQDHGKWEMVPVNTSRKDRVPVRAVPVKRVVKEKNNFNNIPQR